MMDLEITLLTQHLANALTLGFENSGQHEPLEQFLKYLEEQDQGLRVCLVACKNSEPLGYITIAWNSDCPYPEMGKTPTLKDLNVLPKYRRQGVGEHLLKAAEDFVSKNSKSKFIGFYVAAAPDYEFLRKFYVRSGYQFCHERPVWYTTTLQYDGMPTPEPILVLWMIKNIEDKTMKEFSYSDLTSRNYLYISPALQQKIKNTKLVFFGTGLSSTTIEYCVRYGFTNFILFDGDKIELSNLNRQSFQTQEIGDYKIQALKQHLLAINPEVNVELHTHYVGHINEVKSVIDQADIVISTVDCNQTYFDIIEYVRSQNKLVLCPFNPGFGGMVFCFTQDSASAKEVFGLDFELTEINVTRKILQAYPDLKLLEQAGVGIEDLLKQAGETYFPQICIGALMSSALVLTLMTQYLNQERISLAPNLNYFNAKEGLSVSLKP